MKTKKCNANWDFKIFPEETRLMKNGLKPKEIIEENFAKTKKIVCMWKGFQQIIGKTEL